MATHYPYKVAPSQEQCLRHPDKKVPLPQHFISHRHKLKMWCTKCGWLKYKFVILSSRFWIKGQSETVLKRILCEIEENEKAISCQELNPGHPTCAPRALPLSYNSQTTTNPHNSLYMHCTGGTEMPQLHTWCPLSVRAATLYRYVVMSWHKVVVTWYDIIQVYISIFLNSVHLHDYLAGIYLNTICWKFDLYSYLCKVINLPNISILS